MWKIFCCLKYRIRFVFPSPGAASEAEQFTEFIRFVCGFHIFGFCGRPPSVVCSVHYHLLARLPGFGLSTGALSQRPRFLRILLFSPYSFLICMVHVHCPSTEIICLAGSDDQTSCDSVDGARRPSGFSRAAPITCEVADEFLSVHVGRHRQCRL